MIHTPSPAGSTGTAVRVDFTPTARVTLTATRRREGPQTVIVSWPAGAAYLPTTCYNPDAGDVLPGHVAGCPIYADTQRLQLYPAHRMLLDADPSGPYRLHPPLRLRPAAASPRP